jgi:hypothetical protein
VAGRFADGVWLAELAGVRDPAQVSAAVAAALGIHDLPAVAAADALAYGPGPAAAAAGPGQLRAGDRRGYTAGLAADLEAVEKAAGEMVAVNQDTGAVEWDTPLPSSP